MCFSAQGGRMRFSCEDLASPLDMGVLLFDLLTRPPDKGETRRHKELLRDEMMERRRQVDRVTLIERRDFREFLQAIGGNLSPREQQQLADEMEEQNINPHDPAVVKMRVWLEREWTAAGIDVRVCVDPRI